MKIPASDGRSIQGGGESSMNIYKTDIRPSTFDPKKLIARCPKCQNILVMEQEHVICSKCGEEIFVVEED